MFANTKEPQTNELASIARVEGNELPQLRIVDTVDEQQRAFSVKAATVADIHNILEKYANGELVNLLEEEVIGEL